MKLMVTGCIAYDYLMSFSGRFADDLPAQPIERMDVSLLIDSMSPQRGGCAPNIAYPLALLRERPCLMAAAGHHFGEYRQWLEGIGIDEVGLLQDVALPQAGPGANQLEVCWHLGATTHSYTLDEFKRRYEEHFGALTV